MKRMIVIAALALAACGIPPFGAHTSTTATTATSLPGKVTQLSTDTSGKPSDSNTNSANVGASDATSVAASDASSAKPAAESYSLIGRWGDNGDCTNATIFNSDGTFHSESTGGDGQWTLAGDQLSMSGKGGEFHLTLQWIDGDHTRVIHPDGSIGNSQRCAGAN